MSGIRKNILITTKRFPPEAPSTAVLGKELATELAHHRHQVTVAAGYPQHPYGRIFPGFQNKWLTSEKQNGFHLLRGWHFIHSSHSTPIRALVMATQCCSYFLSAAHSPRPDVVISYDGYPLLGPLVSTLIARHYGAKAINVIYDIYPDIAVELGALQNHHLIAVALWLEKLIYRWSDRIIVLSEGFRRTLIEEKGVNPTKIEVIPVWLDEQSIAPENRDNPWRREMGIPPEKFVALYAGTIGLVSGAEIMLEVAQQLTSYPDILILLVGDGYAKDRVQKQALKLNLNNIRFIPFQPAERLNELQATADISLVTLASGRGRTSVPSKVLGYMAASRPVIGSVDLDCDTAKMITQAQCGLVVPPADAHSLAKAILDYYHTPSEREFAGQSGRAFFRQNFEKGTVIKKYLHLIENVIN